MMVFIVLETCWIRCMLRPSQCQREAPICDFSLHHNVFGPLQATTPPFLEMNRENRVHWVGASGVDGL